MQHEVHAELTGTFLGHILPGAILTVWGLWWLWFVARSLAGEAPPSGSQGPREEAGGWPVRTSFSGGEAWFKLVAAFGAGLADLWWASWRLTDTSVMNYQHASAYLGLAFAGGADLLARRGKVAPYVPQLVLAGALANAAFQFLAHGNHLPVSDAVHRFVVGIFLLGAAVLLLEMRYRHAALSFTRVYLMLLQGAWFLHVAWILYRSGWDHSDPYNVMRAHLFFTWDVFGVLVLTWLLVSLVMRSARPGGRTRDAGAEGASAETTSPPGRLEPV